MFDWPTLHLSVASHRDAAEVAGAPPSALLLHRLGCSVRAQFCHEALLSRLDKVT